MKKLFLFAAAALVMASCGGKKDAETTATGETATDASSVVTDGGENYTLPKTIAVEGNVIPGDLKDYVQIDATELSYTYDADKKRATVTLPVKILKPLDDIEEISDVEAEWLDENGNMVSTVYFFYEPCENIIKQSKVGKTQFNITFDDLIGPKYLSQVKSIIFTDSKVKRAEAETADTAMDAYNEAMKQGQDMYNAAMKQGQDIYDKAMKEGQDMYDKAQKEAEEMLKKYGL